MQRQLFILLTLFICSCETFQFTNLESLNVDQETAVQIFVEGGVTTQLTHHNVRLIKPGSPSDNPQYIIDAEVSVSIGENIYEYTIDTDFGAPTYFSNQMFQARAGDICTLTIQYNGQTFTASDQVADVTPFGIDDIQQPIVELAGNELQLIELTKHEFGFNEPNIWYWINSDEIDNDNILDTDIKYFSHRGANLQGVFPGNVFATTFPVSGNDDVIQVAKLSVSAAYYDYLRAQFSETDWKGSVFSTISGNLPSNVSNNGGGFFFASDIITQGFTGKQITEIGITRD